MKMISAWICCLGLVLAGVFPNLLLAQSGIVEIESKIVPENSTFSLSIDASGFPIPVGSVTFYITYEPDKIVYNSYTSALPPILGVSSPTPGEIIVNWFDFSLAGIVASGPSNLVNLQFTAQNGVGGGAVAGLNFVITGNPSSEVGLITGVEASGVTFSSGVVIIGNPAPVTLTSFQASLLPDQGAQLTWETAQEVNNDYFEVERRLENGAFEPIAQVDGAGNTDQPTFYRFVDTNPIGSVTYYRLRQVDFDGAYSYSEVRELRIEGGGPLRFYPNPVGASFTLTLPEANTAYRLSWVDATGRIIRREEVVAGLREVNLSAEGLAAGTYLLHLQSPDGQVYRSKVIKQ